MNLSTCHQKELLNYKHEWDDGICSECNSHSPAISETDKGSCVECGKKGTAYNLFTLGYYYVTPKCHHRIGAYGEDVCWKCENWGLAETGVTDYICKICLMKKCGELVD